jgi:hypothetical protein
MFVLNIQDQNMMNAKLIKLCYITSALTPKTYFVTSKSLLISHFGKSSGFTINRVSHYVIARR